MSRLVSKGRKTIQYNNRFRKIMDIFSLFPPRRRLFLPINLTLYHLRRVPRRPLLYSIYPRMYTAAGRLYYIIFIININWTSMGPTWRVEYQAILRLIDDFYQVVGDIVFHVTNESPPIALGLHWFFLHLHQITVSKDKTKLNSQQVYIRGFLFRNCCWIVEISNSRQISHTKYFLFYILDQF